MERGIDLSKSAVSEGPDNRGFLAGGSENGLHPSHRGAEEHTAASSIFSVPTVGVSNVRRGVADIPTTSQDLASSGRRVVGGRSFTSSRAAATASGTRSKVSQQLGMFRSGSTWRNAPEGGSTTASDGNVTTAQSQSDGAVEANRGDNRKGGAPKDVSWGAGDDFNEEDDEDDEVIGLLARQRQEQMLTEPRNVQAQQQAREIQEYVSRDRAHGVQRIRSQLSHAASVFKELAQLVEQQQDTFDLVGTTTSGIKSETTSAVDELRRAYALKRRERRRNIFLIVVSLLAILVVTFVAWPSSATSDSVHTEPLFLGSQQQRQDSRAVFSGQPSVVDARNYADLPLLDEGHDFGDRRGSVDRAIAGASTLLHSNYRVGRAEAHGRFPSHSVLPSASPSSPKLQAAVVGGLHSRTDGSGRQVRLSPPVQDSVGSDGARVVNPPSLGVRSRSTDGRAMLDGVRIDGGSASFAMNGPMTIRKRDGGLQPSSSNNWLWGRLDNRDDISDSPEKDLDGLDDE